MSQEENPSQAQSVGDRGKTVPCLRGKDPPGRDNGETLKKRGV